MGRHPFGLGDPCTSTVGSVYGHGFCLPNPCSGMVAPGHRERCRDEGGRAARRFFGSADNSLEVANESAAREVCMGEGAKDPRRFIAVARVPGHGSTPRVSRLIPTVAPHAVRGHRHVRAFPRDGPRGDDLDIVDPDAAGPVGEGPAGVRPSQRQPKMIASSIPQAGLSGFGDGVGFGAGAGSGFGAAG